MKTSFIPYTVLFLLLGIVSTTAKAQQDTTILKKEVEVIKAYQPSISDAFKINDIPQIKQTNTEKPVFDYQINPQPILSTFSVEPVAAAQMARAPKAGQGYGLLKGGIGNYQTPYAELFFNTETGRKSTFGMHFKHLSSNGKIKLLNDDKMKAPHSENLAELFTNHSLRNATLTTKLYYGRQAFRYYGYAGDALPDAAKDTLFPFWNAKQTFAKGGIELQLSGDKNSRADFSYEAGVKYQNFSTKTGQKEHLAVLDGFFDKKFELFTGRLDAGLTYLKTDSIYNEANQEFGKKQQIVLKLHPSVLFTTDLASLRLGFSSFSVFDDDNDFNYMLTPTVQADWSPIENTLTLFGSIDGRLQNNHYSAITTENQFVSPFHDIKDTKYQYILNGGIRGKLSSRANFQFQADYASIKNQHFFILNDRKIQGEEMPFLRSNTFDVVYDQLKQLTLGGELFYVASDKVNLLLKSKFYSYELNTQEEAWHKPNYEASASLNFHPEGPLSFTTDIFLVGKRKALIKTDIESFTDPIPAEETIFTIDPILDINFGLNYQYSPQLTFWWQANNFTFQKYESWQGYTQTGFNLLIVASYSF